MWWELPLRQGFPRLLPPNILDVAVRAYSVVEVGGISGSGPERGRNFEALFYRICDRRGVSLSERAGSRTLAEQRSASGLGHEVDGATRSVTCVTHWELKHLTSRLQKNELLFFHGKGLDFLYGASPLFARTPLLRFLLSGATVREECRYFAALWGIMVIEPERFPLPLIYEAVARGAAGGLSEAECDAVRFELQWACRPLQAVLHDLASWANGAADARHMPTRCGPRASYYAAEVMEIQEQIGADVHQRLAEDHPDWIDEVAEATWREVGGW
jgi:hypothetical protein